jgi:hypothetical protein
MARPSKIDRFIEVAKDVLFRDGLMLLTYEELVYEVNKRLKEKDKISYRTFARWKINNENHKIIKHYVK